MAEGFKNGIEADRASEQGNAADRRLTAILDVLLLGAVIIDPQKHRIQNITRYETEEYLRGRRIVDLDRASRF